MPASHCIQVGIYCTGCAAGLHKEVELGLNPLDIVEASIELLVVVKEGLSM